MATTFLTPKEREAYDFVPDEISQREVIQYFTLTPDDLAEVSKGRSQTLRFGFALRLCQLRWLGRYPNDIKIAPGAALEYLSEQLHIPPQVFARYPEQGTTRWDHMTRIRPHLGYREFGLVREEVTAWLLPLALEHDFAHRLLDALIEHLRAEKIMRPGISTLERLVTEVRGRAKTQVQNVIEQQLSEEQRQALDTLLQVPPGQTISRLQWLKTAPRKAAARRLIEWLEKIEACRSLGAAQMDISGLHPNRVKLLARRARRKSNSTIADTHAPERYALLACFLHEALHDLTDQAIEMYLQLVKGIFQRAESKRNKEFAAKGKMINEKVPLLESIGQVILNESEVADTEVRQTIYRRVPREKLAQAVTECSTLAQPRDFNSLDHASRSYSHLREFTPRFMATIDLRSDQQSNPLLDAVAFMHKSNMLEFGQTQLSELR